jgi:hypothetical protein
MRSLLVVWLVRTKKNPYVSFVIRHAATSFHVLVFLPSRPLIILVFCISWGLLSPPLSTER